MMPAGWPLGAVQVSLPGAPVIGQVAEGRQHVHLAKLDGWWDPVASTGTTTQKVNEHGAFLGLAFYGPRVIQAEARIDGFSPGDSLAVARQLMTALSLNELVPLSVSDELGTLTAAVRQEGDPLLSRSGNRMVVSLSMLAPDPRRYGPLVVAEASTQVAASVFNEGDIDSQPVFTVTGPLAGFVISDQDGRALVYPENLGAGETIVIDTAARTATQGSANRVVVGTWPMVRPGAGTFLLSSSTYIPSTQLVVSYRSAWK